jgi:D-amino-acid dehydrogenase
MKKQSIHIVGGGIIGLCSAWYLVKEGYQVTVVDRNDFTDGTSYGNAGMIVPSHFVPMAAPGVITQGLKWLLDSRSPFYVKPRLNLDLLNWTYQFYRSATERKVREAMPLLLAYNQESNRLYDEMTQEEEVASGYEKRGLLMLYKTEKQAEEEVHLVEQAGKLGLNAAILNPQELRELEPEMDLDVLGGVYFPGDAHLYPNRLIANMIKRLRQEGVRFLGNTEVKDFKLKNGQITALVDQSGRDISVNEVLLSSGSWTALLLKKAGVRILLQDGKGYSITLEGPALRPRIPTILAEAKVAITPMGNDLRIGGTLELSGLSPAVDQRRLEGIVDSIPNYYRNLEAPLTPETKVWKGYRPCTPDGLPYLGRSAKISNLIVATGHGMMGLSLGAATGKLVSQIATGQPTFMAIEAFGVDRF